MGVFFVINYKMKCPNCGNELTYFQSYDGKDLTKTYTPYDKEIDSFGTICRKCNADIDLERISNSNRFRGTALISDPSVNPPKTIDLIEFEEKLKEKKFLSLLHFLKRKRK